MQNALIISGPVGNLEARLTPVEIGDATPARLAILCHPHPLYGGSMDDMVLGVLAESLEPEGVASLRFNFRGVGGSDGAHDGKGGEVADLEAVLDWAAETYPDATLTLGGYSFGTSTVCRLLEQRDPPQVERVLLVAPPVGNLPVPEPGDRIPTDVFAGDADAFIDQSALAAWSHARVHVIAGADHFFGGRWEALAEKIRASLSAPGNSQAR
jgi:alpha/beta superfamily hydrolase